MLDNCKKSVEEGMPNFETLITWFAHRQYEFSMGWSIIGQATQLFTFETFAMMFCDKFGIYGMAAFLFYFAIPVTVVIAVTLLGIKLMRINYAAKYMKYQSDVNPDWEQMCKDTKAIRKMVEERG